MSSLGLTPRGLRLLAASVPVGVLGLALGDPVLLAAVAGLWLYVAAQYYLVGVSLGGLGRVAVKPGGIEATLTAGGSFQESLVVESGLGVDLEVGSPLGGVYLEPSVVARGVNSLVLSFRPALSGVFEAGSLAVSVSDSCGLLRGSGEIGFPVSFRVYPRVYPVAVRAVRFLAGVGYAVEGEVSTALRGRGSEYAETREYVPGDSLDMFDWKALARTGSPYVKQFYVEGGGSVRVVLDGGAPDAVSLDELSAGFLGLVVAVAESGAPLSLGVLEKGGVRAVASGAFDSVRVALGMCLGDGVEEFREYYRVVEPRSVWALDRALSDIHEGVMPREPTSPEGPEQVIAVSSLCGDPVPLIRLLEGLGGSSVLSVGSPWLWAPSLGGSVTMYSDFDRKVRVLGRLGIDVYRSLDDLLWSIRLGSPLKVVPELSLMRSF